MRRRGNERRIPRSRAADPVLAPAQLARLLRRTTDTPHEPAVCFVEKTNGDWESRGARDFLPRVGEGREVVAYLHDVGAGRRRLLRFESEEVDERGLGPLDL